MEKCRRPFPEARRRRRIVVDTFPLFVGGCEFFYSIFDLTAVFPPAIVENLINLT